MSDWTSKETWAISTQRPDPLKPDLVWPDLMTTVPEEKAALWGAVHRQIGRVAALCRDNIDFSRFHFPVALEFGVEESIGKLPFLLVGVEVSFPDLRGEQRVVTVVASEFYPASRLAGVDDPVSLVASGLRIAVLLMMEHEINETLWIAGRRVPAAHRDGIHNASQQAEKLPGER